jgi:hypothetical protein
MDGRLRMEIRKVAVVGIGTMGGQIGVVWAGRAEEASMITVQENPLLDTIVL